MIVIIPAAGNATRMRPLSNNMSKAMIPVNGKPIISYIIDHLEETADVSQYVIVENEFKDISSFVSRTYPHLNIKYTTQVDKRGPLDAIHLGWEIADEDDEPVLVWLGDTICLDKFDYDKSFYGVSYVEDFSRWCLIDEDNMTYDKPTERPPTNKALIGVYYFHNRSHFNSCMRLLFFHKKNDKPGTMYEIAALINDYSSYTIGERSKLFVTKEWYDCGELNSYYESKSKLLSRSARSFNKIQTDTFYNIITKRSTNGDAKEKIEKEKRWFKDLNQSQSLFCPRILNSDYGELVMTLEPGTALNDVYVYENLRKDVWYQIINKIVDIHTNVFYQGVNPEQKKALEAEMRNMYFIKILERIETVYKDPMWDKYLGDLGIIKEFLLNTYHRLKETPVFSACMHGDSHLGNIIYEPSTGSIKFVDPRGSFGNIHGTMGDLNYDIAKLLQDFYCGYCYIQAKKFTLDYDSVTIHWNENHKEILAYLEDLLDGVGFNVNLLKRLSVLLLFSAIPFNRDPNIIQAMYYQSFKLIKEIWK